MIALALKNAGYSADWYRQVGAVVVKNKQVLVSGYNKRQPTPHSAYIEDDPRNFLTYGEDTHLRHTLHAEQDVIAQAAKNGISLDGAEMYVTTFPCPDCAANIAASGIKKCYFSEGYAQLDGEKILRQSGIEIIQVK